MSVPRVVLDIIVLVELLTGRHVHRIGQIQLQPGQFQLHRLHAFASPVSTLAGQRVPMLGMGIIVGLKIAERRVVRYIQTKKRLRVLVQPQLIKVVFIVRVLVPRRRTVLIQQGPAKRFIRPKRLRYAMRARCVAVEPVLHLVLRAVGDNVRPGTPRTRQKVNI